MYRVLFVKPAIDGLVECVDVPLGPMYLSACLKQQLKNDVEVRLVDLRLTRDRMGALQRAHNAFEPDLIGISLLHCNRNFLTRYEPLLRRFARKAQIVVGGPYPTRSSEEVVLRDFVSCAVIGEGERTLVNLVRAYRNGEGIEGVRGIAYLAGDGPVINRPQPVVDDLDSLPFPDYRLIEPDHYRGFHLQMNHLLARRQYTHVLTSRGCPYPCLLCQKVLGDDYRARSPENVLEELRWLYDRHGMREFHFVDDLFNLDRARMRRILELLVDSDMDVRLAFPNGLRADLLEPEDVGLLKKAGAYMVSFGIESPSNAIQKVMGKCLDVDKAVEIVSLAHDSGLITHGFFKLGLPGQTENQIRETVRFAMSLELDGASFGVLPIAITDGLDDLARRTYPNFSDDVVSLDYHGQNTFYRDMTGFDLHAFQKKTLRQFYSLPRILRVLTKTPWKTYYLLRLVRSALIVAKY